MTKKELREKYILIRKEVKDKQGKSNIIFERIINSEEYNSSRVIGLYKSLPSEVNTDKLIEYSLNDKVVLLPRVEGNDIVFYRVFNNHDYVKSDFGIYEPDRGERIDSIDLLIVPGVCFDKDRNRIGFGKGYYDRFLGNKNIKTIGICFEEQVIDHFETDEHDKRLNMVITDKNIYF